MGFDVLYVEGPGDIVAAFESWRAEREHASETSVTYSSQLFSQCKRQGLSFMAISYCARKAEVVGPGFIVANMPRAALRVPKIGYQLGLYLYAMRLLALVARHRPARVLVASGVTAWNALPLLGLTGAEVVPILHNALWPAGFRPRRRVRDVAPWASKRPPRSLVVSAAIRRQLAEINAEAGARAIEFRPSFPAEEFAEPLPPQHGATPFRVLFAGRLEENKGVLDVLEIARRLQELEPGAFHFDVCGGGSQAKALDAAIETQGLRNVVSVWGRLERVQLLRRYEAAQVCIVPTRSSFSEGFAQVVAESILLLRPVVTSSVVPASEPFRSAVCLATTDDVASYVSALERLRTDAAYFSRLVAACVELRPGILSREHSFEAALGHLMTSDRTLG